MRLAPHREQWRDHVSGLKPLVADQPSLLAAIDERLKPSKHDKEEEALEEKGRLSGRSNKSEEMRRIRPVGFSSGVKSLSVLRALSPPNIAGTQRGIFGGQ